MFSLREWQPLIVSSESVRLLGSDSFTRRADAVASLEARPIRSILLHMRFICAVMLLATSLLAESVAGLKWTAPAGWEAGAPRPMRAASYTISPANGDTAAAECAIYFFGPGQGGSVDANIDRWKGQVSGADGKPANAKIAKRTIHGLSVTTIDTSGDYAGMGGPMMASKSVEKNYRLLGAIIEGPGGNVFVKFTGPAKTVAARQVEFEKLLNSFEKEK